MSASAVMSSYVRNPRGAHFDDKLQQALQAYVSSIKPVAGMAARLQGESFSQRLWDSSVEEKLPELALETGFLRGIRHGTLDPNRYGQLLVQDCAYCWSALQDWSTATERAKEQGLKELAEFCKRRYESYKDYNEALLPAWGIKSANALILKEACAQYIEFEKEVVNSDAFHPAYTVVLMLPCAKLWGWMANQMEGDVEAAGLYGFWITENLSDDPGRKYDEFIDTWAAEHSLDFAIAEWIFNTSMTCEVNLFRSAYNEEPLPLPEKPKLQA